jgi:hypothetical protein
MEVRAPISPSPVKEIVLAHGEARAYLNGKHKNHLVSKMLLR